MGDGATEPAPDRIHLGGRKRDPGPACIQRAWVARDVRRDQKISRPLAAAGGARRAGGRRSRAREVWANTATANCLTVVTQAAPEGLYGTSLLSNASSKLPCEAHICVHFVHTRRESRGRIMAVRGRRTSSGASRWAAHPAALPAGGLPALRGSGCAPRGTAPPGWRGGRPAICSCAAWPAGVQRFYDRSWLPAQFRWSTPSAVRAARGLPFDPTAIWSGV